MAAAVEMQAPRRRRERPSPEERPQAQAPEAQVPEALFAGMGELAERAREHKVLAPEIRASERQRSIAEGPSVAVLQESPEALAAALRRGQVKRIARVANPLSPDTSHVFTAGGARYAKTGVYVPTAWERAAEARRAAYAGGEAWWEEHKRGIVIAALAVTGTFLLYSAWKNAELRRRLDAEKARVGPWAPERAGYATPGYAAAPAWGEEDGTWQEEPEWPWYAME